MSGRRPTALAVMSVLSVLCAVAVLVWGLAQPGTPAAEATPNSNAPTRAGVVSPLPSAGRALSDAAPTRPSGVSAVSTGPLRVVGFGDSVEAGTNCSGCTAFVDLVGQRIGSEQHREPSVTTVAANGWTTTDILAQLSTDSVRSSVAQSDLVVIEIGANDLDETRASSASCASNPIATCYSSSLATAKKNLAAIATTVKELQARSGSQVVLMGYWNVFADGRVAAQQGSTYMATSTTVTNQFNADAAQVAQTTGAVWADALTPFKGVDDDSDDTRYLAPDGEHPNQAGHQLLAQAVLDALGPRAETL